MVEVLSGTHQLSHRTNARVRAQNGTSAAVILPILQRLTRLQGFFRASSGPRRRFRFKEQPMSRPLTFVSFLVFSALALPASAQVGKSADQPYGESSAGRAMKRIT